MSSSAQLVAVGCVNAIEQMRGGSEEERLRARVARNDAEARFSTDEINTGVPDFIARIEELEEALEDAQHYFHHFQPARCERCNRAGRVVHAVLEKQ